MPKISRVRRRKPGEKQARVGPQRIGYTDGYRRWLIGRAVGFALVGLGVVMAAVHIFAHLGNFSLLPTPAMDDLLIGWPMAAILFLIGVIPAAGAHPCSHPRLGQPVGRV